MMEVLYEIKEKRGWNYQDYLNNVIDKTAHITDDAQINRISKVDSAIKNKMMSEGMYVTSFVVDKGHRNGNEVHALFDNGMIVITNEETKKIITIEIARPGQVKRYFTQRRMRPNEMNIVEVARRHQESGWNMW